ncbi:hypothetical protein IWT5_02243 [Secundilactobacillus silagincola]|uniref:Uncharacterized protein n=1 Tax=Secundilactobacillus silagincola TaxID=1714681 RepID=A0A1Z5J4Q0_9LACO|nr:hypothetical protein IWT5_02243 [Secundilactobacillus silagincola]
MKKQFHLQDIILITMIALIFGAIFYQKSSASSFFIAY